MKKANPRPTRAASLTSVLGPFVEATSWAPEVKKRALADISRLPIQSLEVLLSAAREAWTHGREVGGAHDFAHALKIKRELFPSDEDLRAKEIQSNDDDG